MATKRSPIDADLQPVKRNKRTSPPVLSNDSSEASLSSTNNGLFSDSAASDVTTASSFSSASAQITTPGEEEDESSSESDDSESEGSATIGDEADAEYEEEEVEPVRVTSLPRPNRIAVEMGRSQIDPDVVMAYAKELESRLHAFLPKLRKANSKLAEESARLNMEQVDDSKQHIEMNLDLGVLEQTQVEDGKVTDGIRIPRRDAAVHGDRAQLSPDVSVASLLNGRKDEAQEIKVEVLDDPGAG